jgi:hypothetical protein
MLNWGVNLRPEPFQAQPKWETSAQWVLGGARGQLVTIAEH